MTMFLDEARIAARLHHANVVEIYDLGREGDALFIAMEYVARRRPAPHREALRRALAPVSRRALACPHHLRSMPRPRLRAQAHRRARQGAQHRAP